MFTLSDALMAPTIQVLPRTSVKGSLYTMLARERNIQNTGGR